MNWNSLGENEQVEQIIWHKYPEEKPRKEKRYLIQLIWDEQMYEDDVWKWGDWCNRDMRGEVIAWANLPNGWMEDR